jgi:putative cardiolipin synthase
MRLLLASWHDKCNPMKISIVLFMGLMDMSLLNQKRAVVKTFFSATVLAVFLGGCARLPVNHDIAVNMHLTDTANTRLGQAVTQARGDQTQPTGVYPLSEPHAAYAARVLLIREADRSLDIQYYIWHADTTGYLLMAEVWRAAQRGVRVRLLLDDNGIAGLDPELAALDSHPNIEVRLFNPFVQRQFKFLGYLTDFKRLNRRMHNKSLTADAQATIVGGRNIGDVYFGADAQMVFADLDVLAVGAAAGEVATAFDAYWQSPLAYPVASIVASVARDASRLLEDKLASVQASPEARGFHEAVGRELSLAHQLRQAPALEWVPVQLVFDPPSKALQGTDESAHLPEQIAQAIGQPKHSLDLVSPYFVPGKSGTAQLSRYPRAGVKLRIVTNSLASNDVSAVHSGYAKHRLALLRSGASLFELKPDAQAAQIKHPWSLSSLAGSSWSSLHSKTIASDGQRVFVGSFNLDPRSVRLNTEMGLVIHSQQLAAAVSAGLDAQLASSAYQVELAADGQSLQWLEQTPQGPVRYQTEPKAGLWRRLTVMLMSLLPIDWLL